MGVVWGVCRDFGVLEGVGSSLWRGLVGTEFGELVGDIIVEYSQVHTMFLDCEGLVCCVRCWIMACTWNFFGWWRWSRIR